MHITKEQVPVKIDVPGATARQALDFGNASRWGTLSAEYFSLGAGTDIAPLLRGPRRRLPGTALGLHDLGRARRDLHDGTGETCAVNHLFYWPPGHSVRVTKNADVVLFSPQQEHMEVLDHMLNQMAAT